MFKNQKGGPVRQSKVIINVSNTPSSVSRMIQEEVGLHEPQQGTPSTSKHVSEQKIMPNKALYEHVNNSE